MNWIHEAYASSFAVAMMRPRPELLKASAPAGRKAVPHILGGQPPRPATPHAEPRRHRPTGHYFLREGGRA
jgi:hypothetical protein